MSKGLMGDDHMKKRLCLMLCTVMAVGLFAGCSGKLSLSGQNSGDSSFVSSAGELLILVTEALKEETEKIVVFSKN